MALMFSPDPMPVDVIRVLAFEVLEALLGGITELMVFGVRALRCPIYRRPVSKLKQAAYQVAAQIARSGVLIDQNAGNPHAAGQGGKLADGKFADHRAVRGIDLLDQLVIRFWGDAKLIGLARVVEIFV